MRDRKRKKYVSMALTMVMVMQLWAPAAAWAAVPVKKVKIITEFTELPEDVRHIQIPAGVSEEEFDQYLQFPETIEATVIEEYQEVGGHDHETIKKTETATDSNAEREETEAEDDGNADVETDADTGPEQGELTTATDSNADREELPTATDSDADVVEAQEEDPVDEPDEAEPLENSDGSVVEILRIATDSNAEENDSNSANNSNSSDNSDYEIFDDYEFDDEEILNDIPMLTDIPVTWEMDGLRETEDGSMYYLPVLPVEYVLADGVELPEIQVSVESGIAVLATEEIDISKIDTTATNGQIIINAENAADWDGKILTGSVASTGLYDPGKGIVIQGGNGSDWMTVNLTIRNLTIDRSEYMRNGFSAISVEGSATLNLTVEGNNKLYGAYGGAGIGVPSTGTKLYITENSTGSLYAKGGNGYGGAAGIGSISPGLDLNYSSSEPKRQGCGVIEIAGGDITAEGGTYSFRGSKISGGAGIGATYGRSGGDISISGGTVHAIGGCYGAGIGGGSNGSVDRITISGGTVIAEGIGSDSKKPAAIGLGVDTNTDANNVFSCGTIDIGHANVTAKGNIGYGYVLSDYYPNANVSIENDVYLTLDGVVNAGGASVKQYELNFSVFDTSFEAGQEIEIQSVEMYGNKIQENIIVTVETPGRADFTVSFAHTTFSEDSRTFSIAVEGKEYPYEATIDFNENETKYHGIAGRELYPVDLEFYDSAITENIVPEEITIKQGDTTLDAYDDYVSSNTIEMVGEGVGRMRVFLPANEGGTEITVKAAGINGSNKMTRSGVTVGKDGITSVVMCSGIVMLSAKVTKLNSDGVTIAVKSNALNWDLYACLKTTEITDITPEQIESSNELNNWTVQNGTISKSNLMYNEQYYCYLVAKQENRYSPIVCVEFTTPYGARMFWENGDSNGYGRFLDAIDQTRDIAQEGFTIQALGTSEEWSGGYVTLKKSGKLDFNGKNITINNVTCSLALADGVSAVITDTAGGAEYHNGNSWTPNTFFIMNANSSMTIQGGSYYDYNALLQDGDPRGRTLTIEGGSFHGNNYINIGGNGTLILSGGIFYGGLSVGGGSSDIGNYLKPGYCFHYLSGDNEGTYTTTLRDGEKSDIEVVPYPNLQGQLTLTIGNGIYSKATPGTTLTASFARKGSGTGTYTYIWYRTDGAIETQIRQASEITATTDTYELTVDDIGKQIYCVVKEAKSSGFVESEKTYPVVGYSIEGADITLKKETWVYDGTEKRPVVESVKIGENVSLEEGTHYTVSYENNINAGVDTAKVIVTGTGIYKGTAVKTFTIAKKSITPEFVGIDKLYLYTKSEIQPEFTLKDGDIEIPKTEYTVTYTNNTEPGKNATIRAISKETSNYSFDVSKEFVIYQESVLVNPEMEYTYGGSSNGELHIQMNGNSFAGLWDDKNQQIDDQRLIHMDENAGCLSLKSDFLRLLDAGIHHYVVKMYPQDRRDLTPLEYDFQILVKKVQLNVLDVKAENKTYDGSKLVDVTKVTLVGVNPQDSDSEVSVNTANLKGTLESADAGTYSEIKLPELTLTGTKAGNYELIQPTAPVTILMGVTITKAPAPTITWPITEIIEAGKELQTSKLLGGSTRYGTFTWKNPTQTAEEGVHTYEVVFTPDEQTRKNYEIAEQTGLVELKAVAPASVEHEGEIAAAEPKVAPVPANAPQAVKDIAKVLQNTPPSIEGLETSAKDLLQKGKNGEILVKTGENQTITGTKAKEMLQDAGINTAGKTVKLVVEPYMEVAVNGVTEENGKRIISLEISANYNVKATTAGTGESMEESGTAKNTIVIGTGISYQVDTPVTITIPLPIDYPVENLFIRHILHSGKEFYYPVTVTAENGVNMAEFVNKDGFSTFELLSDGRTGSILYDNGIGTRNYTLEQVGETLPTVNKSGYLFKGWEINGTLYTEFTLKLLDMIDHADGKSVKAQAVLEQINSGDQDSGKEDPGKENPGENDPGRDDSTTGGSDTGNSDTGNSSTGTSRSTGRDTERNTWSAKKINGITRWRYYDSNGLSIRSTWKQLTYNGTISWYHFGADGYMDTGWFMDTDGRWYYLNPVSDGTQGAMKTGWLTDPQDGHRYYLDPKTGVMVTGWKLIDGIWYYFNETSSSASGWSYSTTEKKWVYVDKKQKPLGMLEENKKR